MYYNNGNITQISEVYTVNGKDQTRVLAKYEYDWADQLQKETRYSYSGTSATASETTEVTYASDMAGNLREVTTKVNGTQTDKITYTYGDGAWADRLTKLSVNGVTKDIAYGDYCNPKTWYNGTEYSNLSWTQGRRLSSISKGSQSYSYEYDMSGVRSVKVADGKRHEYVTQNGKVVRDKVTDASTGAFQYMLDFTYDESGHPLTMRSYFNEAQNDYSTYHYVLNAQGDVIKLMHGSNKTVAEYSYDAWGNLLRISGAELGNLSVANLNPLRYRGYYCDGETGFYYLQSRYYDPIVRRFLNSDSYGSTGQGILGYNMFAYCNNNPIGSCDNGGNRPCPASLYGGSYSHDGGGQNPQPPIQYSFCEEGTESGKIKNGREAYAKAQQVSSSLLSTGDFPGAIQSVTVEKTQYHKTGWSALGDSLGDNLLLSSASAAGGKVCSKAAAKVGIKIGGKFAAVAGFGLTVVGGAILNCLHEIKTQNLIQSIAA